MHKLAKKGTDYWFNLGLQKTKWLIFFEPMQVVYALNTKNDEHDAHISCLQEAHELELKKVMSNKKHNLFLYILLVYHVITSAISISLSNSSNSILFWPSSVTIYLRARCWQVQKNKYWSCKR